ncbi:MAG TPA: phosphomannomutase, partial [Candidatus Limnocylindria bacterium]|nr:phosphomannomutase [Candidatus Limnocylindria bacterium]
MDASAIKVVAMDLDGTLTQHKSPLGGENRAALDRLRERYRLLMVGAGACARIHAQMGGYPVDVIGNYGLQYGRFDPAAGTLAMAFDLRLPCDREDVARRILALRSELGLGCYTGEAVELHAS